MRCPDCNKFVSYDEPQCDLQSVDLDESTVRASVTVSLNCQDCGGTLKDAEIESEADIQHDCKSKKKLDGEQFEIESDGDPSGTSRSQTTDRHGKPIRNPRYMKTFYGFELDTEVKCLKCDEIITVNLSGEEQASSFNECC